MDEDYLKYGNKTFGGKWGGYMIGLYNGAGYDRQEANNNKVVSGLLYLRPLPTTNILKGLQLAYVGTYGLSNQTYNPVPAGKTTNAYPDWRTNIIQASLVHPYFTVMGQYYWGTSTKTAREDKDRKGYLASAYVRVPYANKLRVFGKYYTIDPDTDLTASANQKKDEYAVYAAGLAYDWSKEFMPFFAWEREDNKKFSNRTDYDKHQIGFQLRF